MSGLVAGSLPAPAFVAVVAPPAGVPFSPTTLREFGTRHRVVALVQIMQGGKGPPQAVNVRTTIRDASDRVVSSQEDDLQAARFERGKAVPFEYEIPIHVLQNGLHLLRIEASAGGVSTKREMRFTVNK
jgi:hypothetical protein